ncbi:MAG: ribosomal protein S18-alanine N-acetyltransferase [Defluviitaleaceae bacterium]|nr:ribosomal protein S18-alanine N-acetyltransferase [Defluviitaleaceae bacterium]
MISDVRSNFRPGKSLAVIVQATPQHAAAIHAIENEAFSDPWSKSSILYEINEPGSVFLVAVNENQNAIGYASMRHVLDEGHISNIAVSASYKNQGVGSLLMESLVNEARRLKITALTLEVRESNKAAISLYKKYGFVQKGVRRDFYSYPNEDGIVMWKEHLI